MLRRKKIAVGVRVFKVVAIILVSFMTGIAAGSAASSSGPKYVRCVKPTKGARRVACVPLTSVAAPPDQSRARPSACSVAKHVASCASSLEVKRR